MQGESYFMEITNWISLVGGSFFQHIPQFLVIIAGLVFCFSNLKKFPQASRTAIVGLIILFLMNIVGMLLPAIYTYFTISMRESARNVGYFSMIIGFFYSLISAAGLGLLIYAVWIGRKPE